LARSQVNQGILIVSIHFTKKTKRYLCMFWWCELERIYSLILAICFVLIFSFFFFQSKNFFVRADLKPENRVNAVEVIGFTPEGTHLQAYRIRPASDQVVVEFHKAITEAVESLPKSWKMEEGTRKKNLLLRYKRIEASGKTWSSGVSFFPDFPSIDTTTKWKKHHIYN
jgi:hypothetical protein